MKTQKLFVALFLLIVISWPSYSDAGQGCCSYHGGQSYCDTSSGRWVCNDGTYSPSCTCSYSAPKKITILNPLLNTSLDYSVVKTGDNKFSVSFDWADPDGTFIKDYSIRLAKTAGDPGPIVDTTRSLHTFTDVPTGIYVLSLKTTYVGTWTDDYVSWDKIDVSEKSSVAKKPIFVYSNYASQDPAVEPKCESKITTTNDYSTWAGWATFIAFILGISLIISNSNKKKVEDELYRLKFPDRLF